MDSRIIRAKIEDGAVVAAPDLIASWWSFGKTVIAAAALTLVRDGVFALDGFIPSRPYTLRHLLQHRAGLRDYCSLSAYHEAVARGDEPWSVERMLRRARADDLQYEPGQGWSYSNIGYLIVRQLIQHATGEPLARVVRDRVFEPLGITQSSFVSDPAELNEVEMGDAVGYDPRWVYHGLVAGPPHEAALLLDRLLAGALLPEDLLEEMQTPNPVGSPIPGRPWKTPSYGLGLMLDVTGGTITAAGHTGGGPGSVIAVYRTRRIGRYRTIVAFSLGSDQGGVETAAFDNAG